MKQYLYKINSEPAAIFAEMPSVTLQHNVFSIKIIYKTHKLALP